MATRIQNFSVPTRLLRRWTGACLLVVCANVSAAHASLIVQSSRLAGPHDNEVEQTPERPITANFIELLEKDFNSLEVAAFVDAGDHPSLKEEQWRSLPVEVIQEIVNRTTTRKTTPSPSNPNLKQILVDGIPIEYMMGSDPIRESYMHWRAGSPRLPTGPVFEILDPPKAAGHI